MYNDFNETFVHGLQATKRPTSPPPSRKPYNSSKFDDQQKILAIKPTCFFILGKPGVGTKHLGDLISEYWKCVHINPNNLVEEQISIGSSTGKCIEFNLKKGKVLPVDVIYKLLEKKIDCEAVRHRGYVLSGFPLVEPHRKSFYHEEALLFSEAFVLAKENEDIASINKIEDEIDYNMFSNVIVDGQEAEKTVNEQIDFILELGTSTDIIIDIKCSNEDIVSKIKLNHLYTDQIYQASELKPSEYYQDDFAKYVDKPTKDIQGYTFSQCETYDQLIQPLLDTYEYFCDPLYLLKLDGRISTRKMMNIIEIKLSQLSVPQVILPTDLKNFKNEFNIIVDITKFKDPKQFLQHVEDFEISPGYHLSESLWSDKCPVMLSEGRWVDGSPQNAVVFCDNVYLLSSPKAMKSFCQNPRLYLKSDNIVPSCRIAILGTSTSGRTTLARCLAWALKGEVINMEDVKNSVNVNETVDYNGNEEFNLNEKDYGICQALIEAITSVEKQRAINTGGAKSFGGWVIDGMSSDPNYWDMLASYGLVPDDVFCLFEEGDNTTGNFLKFKSRLSNARKSFDCFATMKNEYEKKSVRFNNSNKISSLTETCQMIDEMLANDFFNDRMWSRTPSTTTIAKLDLRLDDDYNVYENQLLQFQEDWKNLKVFLEDLKIESFEISINKLNSTSALLTQCLKKIRYRYLVNFKILPVDFDVEQNTQLLWGETGPYCPIAYFTHQVLWKGKKQFTVKYNQKYYAMSTKQALEEFTLDPEYYIHLEILNQSLPPLRICIIGPLGSGCSTVSKILASEMNLVHIDFAKFLQNEYLNSSNLISRENWYTNITEKTNDESLNAAIIKDYILNNKPLPHDILGEVISKLWFDKPYSTQGIVVDGFPRNDTDLEIMKRYCTVPDAIFELEVSLTDVLKRMKGIYFEKWSQQKAESNNQFDSELAYIKNIPQSSDVNVISTSSDISCIVTPNTSVHHQIEKNSAASTSRIAVYQTQDNSFTVTTPGISVRHQIENSIQLGNLSNFVFESNACTVITTRQNEDVIVESSTQQRSIIRTGNSNEKRKSITIYLNDEAQQMNVPDDPKELNKSIEYHPKMIDMNEASEDDIYKQIAELINDWYTLDVNSLTPLKEMLATENIPLIQVSTTNKLEIEVIKQIIDETKILNSRNESFFEQTFEIDLELAEILIQKGFYFLSSFGFTCPVRVCESHCILETCYVGTLNGIICPVIHRSYIYFCCGKENLGLFRENPLKYLKSPNINKILHIPLKVAVIGCPSSGKTTLANRFNTELALKVLTKDECVKFVLDEFSWTVLASQINKVIDNDYVPSDLVIKAVQLASADEHCLTRGFVLDGFPEDMDEANHLVEARLFPHVIMDVTLMKTCDSHSHISIPKQDVQTLIGKDPFKAWINTEFHNLEVLSGFQSSDDYWSNIKMTACRYIKDVQYYYMHVVKNPIILKRLAITPLELIKFSYLKDFCPTCLQEDVITKKETLQDRDGYIQYEGNFYWFCPQHLNDFMVTPYRVNVEAPDYVPQRIFYVDEDANFYENGRCVVTFVDSFPYQKIVEGNIYFTVRFKNNLYTFATEDCMLKFMMDPDKYWDKNVEELPQINLNDLPVDDYLKRCLGDVVTKAVIETARLRPKYPGLSPALSAATFIFIYLKAHNPAMQKELVAIYDEMLKLYIQTCGVAKETLSFMKKMENPFCFDSKAPSISSS